jgi:hypothetical protein
VFISVSLFFQGIYQIQQLQQQGQQVFIQQADGDGDQGDGQD